MQKNCFEPCAFAFVSVMMMRRLVQLGENLVIQVGQRFVSTHFMCVVFQEKVLHIICRMCRTFAPSFSVSAGEFFTENVDAPTETGRSPTLFRTEVAGGGASGDVGVDIALKQCSRTFL